MPHQHTLVIQPCSTAYLPEAHPQLIPRILTVPSKNIFTFRLCFLGVFVTGCIFGYLLPSYILKQKKISPSPNHNFRKIFDPSLTLILESNISTEFLPTFLGDQNPTSAKFPRPQQFPELPIALTFMPPVPPPPLPHICVWGPWGCLLSSPFFLFLFLLSTWVPAPSSRGLNFEGSGTLSNLLSSNPPQNNVDKSIPDT